MNLPRETIEAAARLWQAGLSASQIASRFPGMTRNGMLGLAHRNRDLFPARPRPKGAAPYNKSSSRDASRVSPARPARPRKADDGRASSSVLAAEGLRDARSGLRPAAVTLAARIPPIADPIPFLRAVDEGGCLFFAGDWKAPSGPDMPVCGAPRLEGRGRYCKHHAAASVGEGSRSEQNATRALMREARQ